jgi:hypothetical protein
MSGIGQLAISWLASLILLLSCCYLNSVTPLNRNWIDCYSIVTFVGSVVLVFSFSVTGLLLLSAMSVIGFDISVSTSLNYTTALAIPPWPCQSDRCVLTVTVARLS